MNWKKAELSFPNWCEKENCFQRGTSRIYFYILPYQKSLYDLVIQHMVCFLHLQQFLLHKSSRIPPMDAQVCRDADTSLMLVLTVCTACSFLLLDNNMYPGVSSGFWLSSLGFQLCRWAIVNAEAEKRCDPLCSKGGTATSPGRKCSDALDDNGQTDSVFVYFPIKCWWTNEAEALRNSCCEKRFEFISCFLAG